MKLIIALILILSVSVFSEAATYTAPSCSYTDVDNTVNNHSPAVVDGDTVVIPAGTCTWTNKLTIVDKSIILTGALAVPLATTLADAQLIETSYCAPGQTTYTCIQSTIPLLSWTTKATGGKNLSGGDLAGSTILTNIILWSQPLGTGCAGYGIQAIDFLGVSQAVRVTGMGVIYGGTGANCWAFRFKQAFGVIDNTTILAKNVTTHALFAGQTGSIGPVSGITYGDESWSTASSQGLVGNVYVEDSGFWFSFAGVTDLVQSIGAAYTDHLYGGRVVLRFNTIWNGTIQNHGTDSGGRARSYRHQEIYRNKVFYGNDSAGSHLNSGLLNFRGGTGKVFDNALTGYTSRAISLSTYRGGPSFGDLTQFPWAYCQQHAVTLTRSGTTATGITANQHGISRSQGYIDITGAAAPFSAAGITADRWELAVSSYTTGNPTTITTAGNHGFSNGDPVVITNMVGGNPSLNSAAFTWYTITTTADPTQFTIPVNVTTANGTGAIAGNLKMLTYTVANSGSTSSSGTLQGNFDGNTDATGYPCFDQLGRGTGVLLTGDGPIAVAVSPLGYNAQLSDPVYSFNNPLTAGGAPAEAVASSAPQGSAVNLANRDFFNKNTSYNGTTQNGIGEGARTSRPASSDTINDGWWATGASDSPNWNTSTTETYSALVGRTSGADGCLDIWNGSSWDNCKYTPFTYPHPLRTGVGPSGAPASPTGLRLAGYTTNNSANLLWTANTETDLAGYRIYCSPVTAGNGTKVGEVTLAGAITSHSPSNQFVYKTPLAKTCFFTVTAFNTTGLESAASSEISNVFAGSTRTLSPARTVSPQRCNRVGGCGSPSSGSNILSESGDKIIIETGGGFAIKEN